MIQLIYYLTCYLIQGIFSANLIGIQELGTSLDSTVFQSVLDVVCQTFLTFINQILFLG